MPFGPPSPVCPSIVVMSFGPPSPVCPLVVVMPFVPPSPVGPLIVVTRIDPSPEIPSFDAVVASDTLSIVVEEVIVEDLNSE